MQTYSVVGLFALLCVLYVAQSAGEAERSDAGDDALKSVEKRSAIDDDKRGFRPDLGKRYDDDDNELRKSLKLLIDSQQRNRRSFRGDLGKRRSSFRGDLGKRPFRGDLGKRGDDGPLAQMSAEKRPRISGFRGDLGKRRLSSFRGDLGKRVAPMWIDVDGDEVGTDWAEDGRRSDLSKRPYAFRGDLGKRRASFRGDLGK